MKANNNHKKIAQSASALGAGILGFGLRAKWGHILVTYSIIIIAIGALLHVWGMYLMQVQGENYKSKGLAKLLWVTAWLCLILLIILFIYISLNTPA